MAEWFEGDVIANGIRLHYHRTGGDKPALVVVHGITDMGISSRQYGRFWQQRNRHALLWPGPVDRLQVS